ncbi:MAG: S41 family peptidase [Candidatus Poribacteria bacterium]|nr:S41 family peptidase [Candidatus Poribacteria bacterium]
MVYSRKYTVPIIAFAAVVVSLLFIPPLADRDALSDRNSFRNARMLVDALDEAVRMARSNYYKDIDAKKMYEGAIKGALAALDDPYTFYLPPVDQKREAENLYHAKFGGLGIRIYADKGLIKISRPLPNTPAMRSGLQSGDYITKVNGASINIGGPGGQTLDDVVDVLRGEIGTDVTITVRRRGHPEPFDVTLTRAEIKIDSVASTMLEDGIGYIQIHNFTGRTYEEFRKSLSQLLSVENGGMQSLILDLRDNPGGLLSAAKDIADAFISEGIIVSTKGRKRKFNQEYPATPAVLCPPEVDLVVLVNGLSASGSEIVAGAIKDSRRGALLGTKTFGKGVVQQRFPLTGGSGAVSLTISTYYTPSGVSINETGIEPNVVVESEKLDTATAVMRNKMRVGEYAKDFVEKWIEEQEKQTGEAPTDFSKLEEDLPQLMATLEENEIILDFELVKFDARRYFDANVGLHPLFYLDQDNQLRETIQLINTGGIEQAFAPTATTDL